MENGETNGLGGISKLLQRLGTVAPSMDRGGSGVSHQPMNNEDDEMTASLVWKTADVASFLSMNFVEGLPLWREKPWLTQSANVSLHSRR